MPKFRVNPWLQLNNMRYPSIVTLCLLMILYKGRSPVTPFHVTGASCHTTFSCMKSDIQTQLNKNISLL